MAAPFRIQRPDVSRAQTVSRTATGGDNVSFYLDRLLKMIPAEVVSLYIVGAGIVSSGIPLDSQTTYLMVWAVICLIGLFAIRIYGTADAAENLPPDWTHIIISVIAFGIWMYSLGSLSPFAAVANPVIGSLLILVWTFFVPIFYRGPKS